MKLTNVQLKQIIREELEVVLTNEEAGEIFGGAVQRQLEKDEAKVEEGHCGAHGEEPPPREPADIVMALEKAMRALGDALDYMRAEHEGALGDVAGDMADKAAMMNVGPMEEGEHNQGEPKIGQLGPLYSRQERGKPRKSFYMAYPKGTGEEHRAVLKKKGYRVGIGGHFRKGIPTRPSNLSSKDRFLYQLFRVSDISMADKGISQEDFVNLPETHEFWSVEYTGPYE
jgi:hypothetical protein